MHSSVSKLVTNLVADEDGVVHHGKRRCASKEGVRAKRATQPQRVGVERHHDARAPSEMDAFVEASRSLRWDFELDGVQHAAVAREGGIRDRPVGRVIR